MHCEKCFKDGGTLFGLSENPEVPGIRLCNGCRWELRSWRNFLKANAFTFAYLGEKGEDRVLGEGVGENARDGLRVAL